MLKIKDNVDLKYLEIYDYGLASDGTTYCKDTEYSGLEAIFDGVGSRTIFINPNTKEITEIAGIEANEIDVIEKDIEDLIKAGFVEKVEEK